MTHLSDRLRLLRTLRFLRPSQVFWRTRYLVQRRWEASSPARIERKTRAGMPARLDPADDFPELPLHRAQSMDRSDRLSELGGGRLTLLQSQKAFRGGSDWRMTEGRDNGRLWNITLHYHEWLYDLSCDPMDATGGGLLEEKLLDWLVHCGLGAPGFSHFPWNSFAIATRAEWWIRLLNGNRGFWESRADLRGRMLESLALQSVYLRNHIEWDLRGNHLLRDARGLALAGRFFRDPVAAEWLAAGTRLGADQATEQTLPDGGHFERSPMYHIHAMEDLLALGLLIRDPDARETVRAAWARMAEFVAWVRHPDGEIPLFNDAAVGAVPSPGEMLEQASLLGVELEKANRSGAKHFPDTGMIVWRGDPWTLFFDVGSLGPDYQPGHGHADTLSFECSFRGRRLVVDPGSYGYDHDANRRYDRSTAAHNTVTVDETDSSEVWHIFRVGRRARPERVQCSASATTLAASAAHTGYRHLDGSPKHHRRIAIDETGLLEIEDRIEGSGVHRVQGGLLLAPDWQATPVAAGWELSSPIGRVRVSVTGGSDLRLEVDERPYHPGYGAEITTRRLGWSGEGTLPRTVVTRIEPLGT